MLPTNVVGIRDEQIRVSIGKFSEKIVPKLE